MDIELKNGGIFVLLIDLGLELKKYLLAKTFFY